jgi:hypothetical protein
MGRKGNSKRKPKQIKTEMKNIAGGSVSSIMQAADKSPVAIHDIEKDSKKKPRK